MFDADAIQRGKREQQEDDDIITRKIKIRRIRKRRRTVFPLELEKMNVFLDLESELEWWTQIICKDDNTKNFLRFWKFVHVGKSGRFGVSGNTGGGKEDGHR